VSAQHSKSTVVKVNGVDLSQYCNSSNFNRTVPAHQNTGYGKNSHTYNPGLLDGTGQIGGTYDNTAVTGPRPTIEAILQQTVPFIRQIEGAGSGKPQDSCQIIITSYVETAPVADNVTWSADFQVSGDVNIALQP